MKELILSTVERDFILKAIGERKRLDNRQAYDVRRMHLVFGVDYGCCFVDLGDTKVMAQVSCEVTVPKEKRPTEGSLVINVELSPMAAPHFESGRRSEETSELQRMLEHCLWESHCVDMESLCITSGRRVWTVRVDIHVLNYDGNVITAASVAAIAALRHFRRPDVTVSGEDVIFHSAAERDLLPLTVVHVPICVSFAFFSNGQFILLDPSQREQLVSDGIVVVAMNKHQEICMIETSGSVSLLPDQMMRCTNIAGVKVTEQSEMIETALATDAAARVGGDVTSSNATSSSNTDSVTASTILATESVDMAAAEETATAVASTSDNDADSDSSSSVSDTKPVSAVIQPGISVIGEGGASCWNVSEHEMDEDIELTDTSHAGAASAAAVDTQTKLAPKSSDSGSEEETVVVLQSSYTSDKNKAINLTKAVKRSKRRLQ